MVGRWGCCKLKRLRPGTIIAVDFDGTLCIDNKPNRRLIQFIRIAKHDQCSIILWTCREGKSLDAAVRWCKDNGVPIDAVNENIPEIGKTSRKVVADIYIDDRAMMPK